MGTTQEDDFCGFDGPFWDLNLTWYSLKPDFTPCFKDTALLWIPSAVFWLLLPFDLIQFYRSHGYPAKTYVGRLQLICQISTTIVFSVVTVLRFVLWHWGSVVWFWWGFGSHVFYTFTSGAIFILSWNHMREGFTGSGAIWLSLLFSVICGLVRFASVIDDQYIDGYSTEETAYRTLFIVYYILTILTLIAFSFSSVPTPSLLEESGQAPFPEDYCSFPNQVSFGWVVPLMWKGYKKDLDIKDLWATPPLEKSAYLVSRFEKRLRKEFVHVVKSNRFDNITGADTTNDGAYVLIKPAGQRPSIIKILAKEFGAPALVAGAMELVNVLLKFVEPLAVGVLTSFAANIHSEPLWHGYFYAMLLACSLFIRSFLDQYAWFRMVRLGRNITSVLTGCIYRKALRLTSEARRSSSLGEIVNLMSVDAARFFDFATDVHNVWSAPLQFILGFYIAYRQVGVAVWAGVGYIVLLSVVNGLISRVYERFQEEQMELKDERVKLLTEILNGMKVIKLYGWEPAFQRYIEEIRKRELNRMRYASYIGAFFEFSWNSTALVASLAVLTTYVLISPNHSMDAQSVFVILAVFRLLTFPLSLLPSVMAHFAMVRVSVKRLVDYFSSQEIDEDEIERIAPSGLAVQLENSTFAWDSMAGPVLHNISFSVPQGKLVAVVGKVGAGKSSLLSALCGEMHKVGGVACVQGSIAYVPQQAWIQNMSLKDNILFGRTLHERNYKKVIRASCLQPDLDSLPAGDETEIGERGINLSGGQKQRVSLARAIYQNRDVYMLDDPLSAVDIHVGKHIFEHVLGPNGILKDKTRILVTHVLTYLPDCDFVYVIADGRVREAGTFRELIAKQGAFAELIQQYLAEASVEELEELQAPEFEALESFGAAKMTLQQRFSPPKTLEDSGRTSPQEVETRIQRLTSISSELSDKDEKAHCTDAASGKLVDAELMQIGQVSWSVYINYAKAAGAGLVLYAVCMMISLVFEMLGNVWLQIWSDNSHDINSNKTTEAIETSHGLLYLGLCGLGQMSFTFILGVALALFQVKAAKMIHGRLLEAILKAPMAFFDTTPAGRITNRCGGDINMIDNEVPSSLQQYCDFVFSLIYSIIGLLIYVPVFGAALVPAAFAYYAVQRVYVTAARRVRRVEAVTLSPIYCHFQETLQGVSTIRTFDVSDRFSETSDRLVDLKFSAQVSRSLFNRWVAVCLDAVGSGIVTAVAFAVVYMVVQGRMTPGVAGLALSSFALNLPELFAWGVRVASTLEMQLVSLERVMEYSSVKSEAPWNFPRSVVSPSWPSEGRVVFSQYGSQYRDGLPFVLRNFTADIQPMEKIGIVGRTGAGKSSLTLALFRIIEAAEGSVLIDDVDISRLGLHELRRKLTIIPQDPVLFSGSLRMNLDPFDEHTDDELWLALERSRLRDFVSTLADGLQHRIDEGGTNVSVGQRQLICLARALLRKSKILVLDEATAAIDVETDSLIQTTIREQFKDCTIITIAHRLNTILDSDRIMVLDKGRLVECDTPENLAASEGSIFATMLKEGNLKH